MWHFYLVLITAEVSASEARSAQNKKAPAYSPGLETHNFELTTFSPLRTPARSCRLSRISQFLPMALYLAQCVNRFVLRFVIRPRSDFAQQADGDQLNAAQKRHRGEQQQRPVLCNHIRMQQELLRDQYAAQDESDSRPNQPQQPEELQRPRRIVQQELHHDQVKEHPDRSPYSVIGLPALSLGI